MLKVLVKYQVWEDSGHWAFDGAFVTRSKVVEVKKVKKINKMFSRIVDIKIL